jgi:LytS/YehU family sensor histidine kinase
MQSHRKFAIKFAACFAAMGFFVVSVFADELLGVLSKVDVEGKKITVVEKDTDKEIEIKITDETEQPTGKNKTGKVDMEKLESRLKKNQDAGKKVNVKVTHDKNVASKLEIVRNKAKAKPKDE